MVNLLHVISLQSQFVKLFILFAKNLHTYFLFRLFGDLFYISRRCYEPSKPNVLPSTLYCTAFNIIDFDTTNQSTKRLKCCGRVMLTTNNMNNKVMKPAAGLNKIGCSASNVFVFVDVVRFTSLLCGYHRQKTTIAWGSASLCTLLGYRSIIKKLLKTASY